MTPVLVLPHSLRRALAGWGGQPDERGGLLLGRWTARVTAHVCAVTRAANVHTGERARCFELDPGHVVRAERTARARGWRLLGTWHSHPGGRLALSSADRSLAWDGALVLVVVPEPRAAFRAAAWVQRAGALRRVELDDAPERPPCRRHRV